MTIQQKIIKNKVGLLNLAQELGNVSKACRVMGFSRDTFYRYQELVEQGGIENLHEKTRRKPNFVNRMDLQIEKEILALTVQFPAYGKDRVADELRLKGFWVSPSGVYDCWRRHQLNTMQLRLRALERKAAEEGLVLTEDQKLALEKKKEESQAVCGEIETYHPGYLGSQDTFYIGHMKGVGKIYQQTFVDTYSKVALCKLYPTKNSVVAADLLNDRVLPFFEEQDAPLLRILTDRGSEYCGLEQEHAYQLYLAINDIEHTRTKAYHPQTNGICERFHRTILQEFYQVTFRKKVYTCLETLQEDLDLWLQEYNLRRPHQGKMCCGRTPMQTFLDDGQTWREKQAEMNLN